MTRNEQRGILAGMVLGDGNITKREMYKNPAIRINHSSKQREYLKHKIALLQPMFHYDLMKSYREIKSVNNQNGKTYKQCVFYSRVNPKLKTIWKDSYFNGKKVITKKLLNHLTPQGLAIWYMDDGCCTKQRRTVMLSTYCSYEENLTIIKYFKEKWKINWVIGKHKDKFFVQRGWKSDDMAKFMKIIKPYIIPSMKYKLVSIAATSQYER